MRFAGYAAIFDRADRGGDVVRRGAFAGALGNAIPLLWQHDARREIGRVEHLSEDEKGLRVIGHLTGKARVEPGAGLSFGYRVKRAVSGTKRELLELDLIEVSVVRQPMQPLARVHAVDGRPELIRGEDDGL